MSAEGVLDGLLGPSFEHGGAEAETVELYVHRLLALDRAEVYEYLYARTRDFLLCLPRSRQRAIFVLSAWRLAPPEHWGHWANAMPDESNRAKQGVSSMPQEEIAEAVGHMVRDAANLEPEAIRSVIGHLRPLHPALAGLENGAAINIIVKAGEASLGEREWWSNESWVESEHAMHDLLIAIEEACPASSNDLRAARAADLSRSPLDSPAAVRGMVSMAHDLSDEAYDELIEGLPDPNPAELPELFAEVVAARVVLRQEDPAVRGGASVVAGRFKDLSQLKQMGPAYRHQLRRGSIACLDLRPSPSQLQALSIFIGPDPGQAGNIALLNWTRASDRKTRSRALVRLIRPRFDATKWAEAISTEGYEEAPVIRALSQKLNPTIETSTVEDRQRMSRIVLGLEIHTQAARDATADLIIAVLAKGRPKSDLRVALVLSEGLGADHNRAAKLKHAFESYADRHARQFTPDEYKAIVRLGLAIGGRHLSKRAKQSQREIMETAVRDGADRLHGALKGLLG